MASRLASLEKSKKDTMEKVHFIDGILRLWKVPVALLGSIKENMKA